MTHRLDVLRYVDTGELACTCGWVSPAATRREWTLKRAIGTHATHANRSAKEGKP